MTAAAGTSHWAVLSLAGRFKTQSGRSRALLRKMAVATQINQRVAAFAAHELVLPTWAVAGSVDTDLSY